MNFTREPITETIITPKEGCKLIIRNTKGGSSEYNVDAVEVVNFGTALFFRSLERPKSFLLPVSDFEVVETKETRVAIKAAQIEKSVKISGGKQKDEAKSEEGNEKKKRRVRRKRNMEEKPAPKEAPEKTEIKPTSLFAPPEALISEQMGEKYKSMRPAEADLPEEVMPESQAAGQQEAEPIEHTPLEDDPAEEMKPDAEIFETTTEVETTSEVKLPTPTPDTGEKNDA